MEPSSPRQELLCFTILQLLFMITSSAAFRFSLSPPFTNLDEILIGGNATKTQQSLQLTPDSPEQVGRAIYWQHVKLVDNSSGVTTQASFSTSFTFRITVTTTGHPGSGFAFFLSSSSSADDLNPPPGSGGGYLGLTRDDNTSNSSSFVAVEFDTYQSQPPLFSDISDCHIGIDVNSVQHSLAVVDLSPATLSNLTLKSWIDYDSSSGVMEVRLDQAHKSRPQEPLLYTFVGPLSRVLGSRARVGFSAATSLDMTYEKHEVLEWSFASGGFRETPELPPSPVPSLSPSQQLIPPSSSPSPSAMTFSPPAPPTSSPSPSPLTSVTSSPQAAPPSDTNQWLIALPPSTGGGSSPGLGIAPSITILSILLTLLYNK